MDRNFRWLWVRLSLFDVALRKESVDRNYAQAQLVNGVQKSLSARRAWIEINYIKSRIYDRRSLSARRAWIEINCDGGRRYDF